MYHHLGYVVSGTLHVQMEDGTGKRTLHPAQYLALAYGLMPQLRAKLLKPLGTLVTE